MAKKWLRKINPEIKEIDINEFREIIDKLTSSENIISSSLGIILSYYSGFPARNLAVLIDNQNWVFNNLPYLMECLDNLPINKTDFIEKGIESKDHLLIFLALDQITNEFTCDDILNFFKKLLIVLNNYSKEEKKPFSVAVVFGSSSYKLDQVMIQFRKKWIELSNLFIIRKNNCMKNFSMD